MKVNPVQPGAFIPTAMRPAALAHAIFRLALGVNTLIHGVNRLFDGPGNFAASLLPAFRKTPLPPWSVLAFGWSIPFVETALGVLLILGLFTRSALAAGGLLMVALTFGTALRNDYATLSIQLLYSLAYYVLLRDLPHDQLSLDAVLRRGGGPVDDPGRLGQ